MQLKERRNSYPEMQKLICEVYEEGAVTDEHVESGLWSLGLEISLWTMMLHSGVDQLKLIEIKLRH